MKKVLLAVAVVLAITAAACSGTTAQTKENEKSLKTKIETCTNPDSLQMYVNQAKCYADSLAAAGKTEEAKKYLEDLEPAVAKADPSLKEQFKSTWESIEATTKAAADSVKNKVSESVDSLGNAAGNAKDKLVEKSGEVKDKVADKANETYNKGKDAVNEVAKSVGDAAQKTLDKLKK